MIDHETGRKSAEAPELVIKGRHIIHDGDSVLGGVFLARAGIVVDVAENPAPYQRLIRAVDTHLENQRRWAGKVEPVTIFETLFSVIESRFMPFDTNGYAKILRETAVARGLERLGPEDLVGLSEFTERSGICQQQALLCATALELMQIRGDIDSATQIGIESEHLLGPNYLDRHIRVVIEQEGGPDFSIDTNSGVSACREVD